MHITITTIGSRGDVQPFVALGKGLQSEGHVVRIATHRTHRDFVREHDLEFASVEGNPREMLESVAGQSWLKSGGNPFTFWRRFRKLCEENVEKSLNDAVEACRGTDAIIYTFFGAAGYHIAEKLGVHHLMGMLQPISRTREFAHPAVSSASLGATLNWCTYLFSEQVGWLAGRRWTNRWRQQALRMPPLPLRSPFSHLYATGEPFIYGISEHVVPRPADWPPTHEMTGYWFLDGDSSWTPPHGFVDFLDSGSTPVYVGFGSMAGELPAKLTDITINALAFARKRGVLCGGWATAAERDLPDSVYAIQYAPHDWLFPRMAAAIHHGGAGTTAAALRAGLPSVVVPFFADQPFWAERVRTLGAGPETQPWKRHTDRTLARAIGQAVVDRGIQGRAMEIGGKLRAERGVDRAVETILAHFSR